MTHEELKKEFDRKFGMGHWPQTYEVDADTYANVCQSIFDRMSTFYNGHVIEISIGKNCGIMFKGVELILEK